MRPFAPLLSLLALLLLGTPACANALAQQGEADAEAAESKDDAPKLSSSDYGALKLRSVGPALTGGRVTDFAVMPGKRQHFYAALAAGGIWETKNAGATWNPIFDGQASYSIGCLALDPNNPHVIWAGSGENNSQRAVAFGDGVYRSRNGGKSWENLGLKESEHIGKIVVDPRDSNTVFVAAQGPLWREGGDRGLYKTTDGGKEWRKVLEIDEHTGVNEVHIDPRNPDVMYASSYQRARRVWTLINGGPGSAIHKSEDGGETWRKLSSGIPGGDKGKIGMAVSPANPDVIYAIIELAGATGGVYRSVNRGETWTKQSSYVSSSPQYYNELVAHPHDPDVVYSLDTYLQISVDGGKNFNSVPNTNRHVDDHALWIDPADPDYLLVGCDGGVYDSHDRGTTWAFRANMPITQFYRVSVDNQKPFYYLYGGTQDNNSLGGPSQTTSSGGIANEDWFVTVGGDGYETIADAEDPMILYSLWQYGGLVRHDRRSMVTTDIKPREREGDEPYRWNWDSPLIQSPHQAGSIYFAANRLFRSDDRGNSWQVVSPDLSRQIDRNTLPVMGKVWGIDSVAKNRSTSQYGNIVALAESPLVEGLLYVGTDDGLIQVSEDGGASWRKQDSFPDIDKLAYVTYITPSLHDADTVYASFTNFKAGDFTPYLLKSSDRGRSWTSIASDIPERNFVWAIAQDHVNEGMLFVGTEFGLYFTLNEGGSWHKMKSGLPTIAVRDLDIARDHNDLVLATFGRSFYILDDYSPLRALTPEGAGDEVTIYPIEDALMYGRGSRLGGRSGKGSQGAGFYVASNPAYGATFTYTMPEKFETLKDLRKKREKEQAKDGGDVAYPSWEELRAEESEKDPAVMLIVRDSAGRVVRRLNGSKSTGMHRTTWDLREAGPNPVGGGGGRRGGGGGGGGPFVLPGTYSVQLATLIAGKYEEIGSAQSFRVMPLGNVSMPAPDAELAFAQQSKAARLVRAVRAANGVLSEMRTRIGTLRQATIQTPGMDPAWVARIEAVEARLTALNVKMNGDSTVSSRQEPTLPGINTRIGHATANWSTMGAPTATELEAYRIAGKAFESVLAELRTIAEQDMPAIEAALEAAGAGGTPGRLPNWKFED
jgi:photosystem II stability/assembly factor-like uncharacterized protein